MESIIGNVYLFKYINYRYRTYNIEIVVVLDSIHIQVLMKYSTTHSKFYVNDTGRLYNPVFSDWARSNNHYKPNLDCKCTFLFHSTTNDPLEEFKLRFPEYFI